MKDQGNNFKLKRETITKLSAAELKDVNGGSSWLCVGSGVAIGYSVQKLDQYFFPNGFGNGNQGGGQKQPAPQPGGGQKLPGSRVFKTPGGCAD